MNRNRALVLGVSGLALALAIFVTLLGDERDNAALRAESAPNVVGSAARPGADLEAPWREPISSARSTDPSEMTDDPGSPDRAIRVRVTDGADRPLAGARVRLLRPEPHAEARTADDGTCTFRVPRSTEAVRLFFECRGYVHADWTWVPPLARIDVPLSRATVLTGRVVDSSSGAPIAGASVARIHSLCDECPPDRVRTAASGAYRLENVPEDDQNVPLAFRVEARGYPAQAFQFHTEPTGEPFTYDFRLAAGVEISGIVRDFESDEPVPGASVSVGAESLISDATGRFAGLAPVVRDGVWVGVTAPGYCRVDTQQQLTASEPLIVRLPREAVVDGVVTDPSGTPLAGVAIHLQRRAIRNARETVTGLEGWDASDRERDLVQRSDEAGRFRFEGLAPGGRQRELALRHPGYAAQRVQLETLPAPGEAKPLELVLTPGEPAATLEGWVTLNGRPPWDCSIKWTGPTREGYAPVLDDGSYRAEDVEPGTVALHFSIGILESLEPLPGADTVLRIERDATVRHDFHLRFPSATISGRVLFDDGGPVSGLEVACEAAKGGDSVFVETAADGSYSAEVIEDGQLHAVVFEHGKTAFTREVLPGASGVDFVVPRAAQLFARIVDGESGEAVQEDVELYWRRSGESALQPLFLGRLVPFESDLWHRLELPASRVDLWVVENRKRGRNGFQPARIEGLELASEHANRAVFELERGLTVRFVMDPSNEPQPNGRRVHLLEDGSTGSLPEVVLAAREAVFRVNEADKSAPRSATVRGLAPGRYRLATSDDLVLEPASVELKEGVFEPIVVSWSSRE